MAASWKRQLEKEIRAQHRRVAREQLAHLRDAIRHAKQQRKAAICRARNQCKTDRLALRARLKAKRASIMARLVRLAAREREEARKTCVAELEAAKGQATRVAQARAELAAERKYRRELRRIEAANRAAAREHKHATRAEKRSESDDEVRANIPESYLSLWERVKGSIRANPRMSRTEAFMHYAEEHPEELLESLEDVTERMVRELEAKERAAAKRARRPPRQALQAPF